MSRPPRTPVEAADPREETRGEASDGAVPRSLRGGTTRGPPPRSGGDRSQGPRAERREPVRKPAALGSVGARRRAAHGVRRDPSELGEPGPRPTARRRGPRVRRRRVGATLRVSEGRAARPVVRLAGWLLPRRRSSRSVMGRAAQMRSWRPCTGPASSESSTSASHRGRVGIRRSAETRSSERSMSPASCTSGERDSEGSGVPGRTRDTSRFAVRRSAATQNHMETPEFERAISGLVGTSGSTSTAIMCAETLWWQCPPVDRRRARRPQRAGHASPR